MLNRTEVAEAGIIGLAVGDALGVPVEFYPRETLQRAPVTGMRSHGTHNQPAGTWSDDTSLALCLAESLVEKGIDYADQAQRFIAWANDAKWTAHDDVFDIGNTTTEAIFRLQRGGDPLAAGPANEFSCGNGSLMRILPLAIYLANVPQSIRWERSCEAGRLTHGHPRCQIACAIYVEIAASLVRGESLETAVAIARAWASQQLSTSFPEERTHFSRILSDDLAQLTEAEINSSGYVIHCLEASLWCALRATSYAEGVLAAVNLGADTDTTAAVTGGLLGLRFGVAGIPSEWQNQLARRGAIAALCQRLQAAMESRK